MNILTTTEKLKVIQRRLGRDKKARIIANARTDYQTSELVSI